MWTSSTAVGGADRFAVAVGPGAEEDQHRPQPLTAGVEGRDGVRSQSLAEVPNRPPQQLLDLAEARRQPAAGGVEDRRHRGRDRGRAGHRSEVWGAIGPRTSEWASAITRGCRCGSR